MKIPKAIQNLIDSFEKLPGIGPKTAQRLTFYLLHVPQTEIAGFAAALENLKKNTVLCSACFSIGEHNPCEVCAEPSRDKTTICVVEQPLDVVALEKSKNYNGLYHILHGRIDPLNNIGPDEIYINQLITRIKDKGLMIKEIILATNPTMEGEATAMYIAKKLGELKTQNSKPKTELKITRIGRGLPTGADLEYADELTLQRAMEGRREY